MRFISFARLKGFQPEKSDFNIETNQDDGLTFFGIGYRVDKRPLIRSSTAFFHGHKRSTNSCGAPSGGQRLIPPEINRSSLDSIDLPDSGSGGNKSLFSPSIGLFLLRELIRILRRSRGIVATWELCCGSMTRSTKAVF